MGGFLDFASAGSLLPRGARTRPPREGDEMDDYQEELLDLHARERDMPEPADDATEL
ncbi:hypothetical protein [Metapseudomonas otitidis]|uniref:hypothetical protein n=1 Tax=Metapseudomonas otitidis TaxID=319939 RepID=UPI001F2589F7|nr:hypothetical protein [Pseudomonas otitidis]